MPNLTITPLNFAEWGHSASDQFLADGTPMSQVITKIAAENELSPTQIQRVCEIANHRAYAELFKTAEDKTFGFPLAKAEEVMEMLQAEPEKVASDYYLDPVGTRRGVDCNKIFGIEELGNSASVSEAEKIAGIVLEKIAAAKDEIRSRLSIMGNEIDGLEGEFYKQAKQMVLDDTPISEINAAVRDQWQDEEATKLMAKTAVALAAEGIFGARIQHMVKTSEAVEQDLISGQLAAENKGVPVRVINGNHPIICTINTLADRWKDAGNMEQSLEVLDEKARMVKTKMKDLNTSKKVDQFVQTEVF